MKKLTQHIDLITNILTIIVAVLLISFFVQRYFFPNQPLPRLPIIGNTIVIDNLETSQNSKNVLFVMMKGCHFCEESMEFYKKTIQQNQNKSVKFVAVFPPNSKEIENYLHSYGISGVEIKYSELSKIDVDGTPTIIVADQNGRIVKTWSGKLSSTGEKDFLDFLNS